MADVDVSSRGIGSIKKTNAVARNNRVDRDGRRLDAKLDMGGGVGGRVTLRDIAERAGVSRSTVSLVLRQSPLVRNETRDRVQSVIAELGYVYHRGAASLRSQKTQTIGLVINDVTNPFYGEFTAAIDDVLEREGWVTLFGNCSESVSRQAKIIDRMREQGVDGMVICPALGTPASLIETLRRSGVPCVQATRFVTDRDADYVGQANVQGMKMATEHLIGLGHREIAFIGGSTLNSSAVERAAGYRTALERHGIHYDPAMYFACETRPEVSEKVVGEVLKRVPRPTAAVCMNDFVAFGVVKGLIDRGLAPGRDFAVVGFDNRRDTLLCRPGLTTVSVSAHAVAKEAAGLILRRIQDPAGTPEWISVPPHELVVRETCGARLADRTATPETPVTDTMASAGAGAR